MVCLVPPPIWEGLDLIPEPVCFPKPLLPASLWVGGFSSKRRGCVGEWMLKRRWGGETIHSQAALLESQSLLWYFFSGGGGGGFHLGATLGQNPRALWRISKGKVGLWLGSPL